MFLELEPDASEKITQNLTANEDYLKVRNFQLQVIVCILLRQYQFLRQFNTKHLTRCRQC